MCLFILPAYTRISSCSKIHSSLSYLNAIRKSKKHLLSCYLNRVMSNVETPFHILIIERTSLLYFALYCLKNENIFRSIGNFSLGL